LDTLLQILAKFKAFPGKK